MITDRIGLHSVLLPLQIAHDKVASYAISTFLADTLMNAGCMCTVHQCMHNRDLQIIIAGFLVACIKRSTYQGNG